MSYYVGLDRADRGCAAPPHAAGTADRLPWKPPIAVRATPTMATEGQSPALPLPLPLPLRLLNPEKREAVMRRTAPGVRATQRSMAMETDVR